MDLFDRLGPGIAREFSAFRGKLPSTLLFGPEAAHGLSESLKEEIRGRSVAVVFDSRTRIAAGEELVARFSDSGWEVQSLLVPDAMNGGHPKCDDLTMSPLLARIGMPDAIVGVGSGVISDLSKWLGLRIGRPSAMLATAASMNGYASSNVAATLAGVKDLVHARAHRIIGAQPAVLAKAPRELGSAGFGDLLAKTVSIADWRVNAKLFGEFYSDSLADLFDRAELMCTAEPTELARRDETAISRLFEALVYSGCGMTLQGSSLPASGGEHLISHALDMTSDNQRLPHDLHGRQVGVSTIFVAGLYEELLQFETPQFRAWPLPFRESDWGAAGARVASHYQAKSEKLSAACVQLSQGRVWEELRIPIAPTVPEPARIKNFLRDAGAAHRLEDIGCTRERFLWSVLNCAQIRERFTSIDLAWAAGILPQCAELIIDRYLS